MARHLHPWRAMPSPWVVVLAGGEGTRLGSLTRALYGTELPKQFAVLVGDRSLLQTTVERAMKLTVPERISIVASASRAAIARAQLAPYPGVELVIQPRNLDTGPGLLFPLVRIVARDPGGQVVFLPSDHYFSDDDQLLTALRGSVCRRSITLIGVSPTGPEVEYGWIMPGRKLAHGAFAVAGFHEKPPPRVAEQLFRTGGLWNTFISTGMIRAFWDLAQRHLPAHAELLARYATAIGQPDEPSALEVAYATMEPANFSRDVLARTRDLAVVKMSGTGWSDWGSPQRVFASLDGSPDLEHLLRRIREPLLPSFDENIVRHVDGPVLAARARSS